jgi:aspartate aminotransferase
MVREPSLVVQRLLQSERAGGGRNPTGDVVSLQSGDPDFPTPPHIVAALNDAVEAGYTHYAAYQGDPQLRAVIAEQLAARSGVAFTADDITMTNGGGGANYAALMATVDAGDQVLIPDPSFSQYGDVCRVIGAEVTPVPSTPDYHLDIDAFRAMAKPNAKLVVLVNPCNPTGAVYRRDELEQLAEFCVERDLYLLSDEAYELIVFDGREFVSALTLPGMADRLLYCQTFSKTYAMTGWRLGYLAARGGLARHGMMCHRTAVGTVNNAVQRAGLVALTTPSDAPELMRAEYEYRRGLLDGILRGAPGMSWSPPEGTFYAMVRYDAPISSREMRDLALAHGVTVRSGTEFGPSGEGHVRLSFATSRENIIEGAKRLAATFSAAQTR